MKVSSVVVSRCDRLGDLVLSLPAVAELRRAGLFVYLHVSAYARDVALWAKFNGVCDEVWIAGEPVPSGLLQLSPSQKFGLALFHSRDAVQDFRHAGLGATMAPRTRLSTLWSYSKTVSQKRSRIEKSEMTYNWELACRFLEHYFSKSVDKFQGLPKLEVPAEWRQELTEVYPKLKMTDWIVVLGNRGSALNWRPRQYIEVVQAKRKSSESVGFLVSGLTTVQIAGVKTAAAVSDEVVNNFHEVRHLITWISMAKKVWSSSTGPLHIAHAAGVAVHGIYPPSNKWKYRTQSFKRWRPDGFWHSAPVTWEEISEISMAPNGRSS